MEFFHSVSVNWLGKKWYFLAFSMIFSVAGIISMGMHYARIGSPVPLGVDFKGGTQVQVRFAQTPDTNRIRQAMAAAGVKDVSIQAIHNPDEPSGNDVLIGLPEQQNENALDQGRQQIVAALQSRYDNPFTVRNVQVVGPTVGHQLEKQAGLATLYSMAGMLVGYSMNDTIVVFDRIRENLRLSRRESLPDLVNRSINQTLSRTVLTSGLTFLTVLSLYVFGGQVLRGFSFALVVGILIGTYSSIAVAAPMLVAWQEWRAQRDKATALPASKRARG